jgi:predicted SAM-dependent methyltransferase
MKIHLGCGQRLLPDYINVDIAGSSADVECDIHSLPWGDGVADEILAVHVVEHLPMMNVGLVLKEWARVLKPGGKMILELPCREKVFDMIGKGVTDPRLVMFPLYGDPRTHKTTADVHRWLWGKEELAMLMHDAGLVDLTSQKPLYHVPIRDMRLVGTKGAPNGDQ